MEPSYGVVVGRFQVHKLHAGHMELLKEVSNRHSRVVVFIGVSAAGYTKRNPLDFMTRKAMIQAAFPEFAVLPIKDCRSDAEWSEHLDAMIGEFVDYGSVTLYGGRDSFVPHYTGKFKPVEINLSIKMSGEDIRKELTDSIIESPDFRAGAIFTVMNQRPRVVTCVDVVIRHEDSLLLAQKPGEALYRFVGGHAEPDSDSFEDDAKREVMEETGLDVSNLQYVGSHLVKDWRYEKEDSKIKTLLFVAQSMTLGGKAHDDIETVQWFPEKSLAPSIFVPAHKPLFEMYMKWREHGKPTAANG